MLPIIDGSTRNFFVITASGGKKKYAMSYSFHLDTGYIAYKAGVQIQHVTQKGYVETSRFLRRKYRTLKVRKALRDMRKSLSHRIKFDLPIDLKSLKSRLKEVVQSSSFA